MVSMDSSEISAAENVNFEARNRRESEYHVFGLVCETKWSLAVAYFRQQHLPKYGPGIAGSRSCVGWSVDEEDVANIVKIYCQILAERGESTYKQCKRDFFHSYSLL